MTNKTSLVLKRIGKIILFILIFTILTCVLNFCIVVPNTSSCASWEKYARKSNITTLFIGSSVGQAADVDVIDAILGTTSVNMSTPDQLYKTQYDSIDFITKQNPIDKVVLIMELDSIKSEEHYIADYSFRRAMYKNASIYQRLLVEIKDKWVRYQESGFCGESDSINIWFGWVKCPLKSWESIKNNTFERLNDLKTETDWDYVIDFNNKPYIRKTEINDEEVMMELDNDYGRLALLNIKCFEMDVDALEILDCILRYLKTNDIECIVMVAPCRLDEREKYGDDYNSIDDYMRGFIEKRGGKYINLDTDEEVRNKLNEIDEPFRDGEHLNANGIQVVSPIIAERLAEISN